MKSSLRSVFILAIVATLGLLMGCGGGSGGGGGGGSNISVSVQATPTGIPAGGSTFLAATLTNDTTNAGVTWSLSGPGFLSNANNFSVTYNGPSSVTGGTSATITATSVADTTASGSAAVGVTFPIAFVNSPQTTAGGSVSVIAKVVGDSSAQGVTWSVLGGPLTLAGQSAQSATFNVTPVSVPTVAYVQATSVVDNNATGITTIGIVPGTTSTANTQYITVDGGPSPAFIYPNGGFTSATVCAPGSTTNCVTVNGLLVDTGSVGLRVLAGSLGSVSLTPISVSGGTLNNCVAFVDGSFLWGQVAVADVYVGGGPLSGGEKAANTPIQMVADPSFTIPSTCDQGGVDEDNQIGLGANGIIGIGPEPDDCGGFCTGTPTGGNGWPYYACSGSSCTQTSATLAQQVTGPIVNFGTDNNGSLINFPAVVDGQPTTTGTITFGIATQTNNAVGSATVYTMDTNDSYTTNYNGQVLTGSFVDSGSNAFFFPDNTIPVCSDFTSFYCPSSTLNLSAQTVGATQGSGTVLFNVANTDALFNNSSNPAYGDLGGPNTGNFDWGLPFFFGRTTFTSIRGTTVSGQPATPWWAY